MGLFSQQPEQDDEWAGIPSEPRAPETDAERLTSPPADAASLGMLGTGILGAAGGAGVESIVIPVVPTLELPEAQESGEGGGSAD